MAIAGSTQEAFVLHQVDGRLVEGDKKRVLNAIITDSVEDAVRKLWAGEQVYLLAYGDNLTRIRREFA